MKQVVAIIGVSLVMGFAAHAGAPKAHPNVDKTVYVKQPVDKRRIVDKPTASKPAFVASPFVSSKPDPKNKTVHKTPPAHFQRDSRYVRHRSHFSEWP